MTAKENMIHQLYKKKFSQEKFNQIQRNCEFYQEGHLWAPMKYTKDCQKHTTKQNWLQRDVKEKETYDQASLIPSQDIPGLIMKLSLEILITSWE
jgi:hypothetical protein